MSGALSSSRLQRVAQRPASEPQAVEERCDLCGEPIPPGHRHLLDLETRQVSCACRPCSLLFDRPAAGGGHWRLIPDGSYRLVDFQLDEATWDDLRIPVEMAFFFRSSSEEGTDSPGGERVRAFYPSPMGPTESLLGLEAWTELEQANPVLRELQPDTEALLVNRSRGARQYFLVPIDECYRLVGLIRTNWRGFTGGKRVWEEIGRFFDEVERSSRPRQAKVATATERS